MKKNKPYSKFAQYYDKVMFSFESRFKAIISEVCEKHKIDTDTVLELGCGTGSNLKYFEQTGKSEVFGLDTSEEMIVIAKNKLHNAELSIQDMSKFKIDKKFNLIFCVFDSINHLMDYNSWLNVFRCVDIHLKKGGYFIFDINTQVEINKKKRLISTRKFDESNFFIMENYNIGKDKAEWHLRFLINEDTNKYILHEEIIREKTFPVRKIENDLNSRFRNVDIYNYTDKLNPFDKNCPTAIFVCKKG